MSNNNSIRRQPGVKKHKNRTLTGSNPPVSEKHCFNIFVFIRPLRGRLYFIFYPAILAGLLLFDLRCRSGKIHNKHLLLFDYLSSKISIKNMGVPMVKSVKEISTDLFQCDF